MHKRDRPGRRDILPMVNTKMVSCKYRAEKAHMDIVNHGQIERLTLPDGWSEDLSVKRAKIGSRSSRQFHPKETSEARLHLFYRGFPISASEGKCFASVLSSSPHTLLSSEIKALAAVLGQRANSASFMILSLRTEDLNGRRVLVLEGRYK